MTQLNQPVPGPGMYFSDRCGYCGEFDEKVAPFICTNCWGSIVREVRIVLGDELADRFAAKGPALLLAYERALDLPA